MTTPQNPEAVAPPPYWIAAGELWIRGPGGNVRAHQAGDRVSNSRVAQYGWEGLVTDPAAEASQDAEDGPEAEDGTSTPATPALAATAAQVPAQPPAAKIPPSPASTSDSGPAAEGATT